MKKLLFILSLFLTTPAIAEEVIIDMLNKRDDGQKMVYSLDVAKVNVGDTIKWLPKSKGHNVEFIKVPDGVKRSKKSKLNKEYSYTFDKSGIYLYQCTPHASMGMIALVVVGEDTSNLDAIAGYKARGKSKKKLKELLANM